MPPLITYSLHHAFICTAANCGMMGAARPQVTSLTDSPDPDEVRRFKTGLAGLDNSFFAAFARCARRRRDHP